MLQNPQPARAALGRAAVGSGTSTNARFVGRQTHPHHRGYRLARAVLTRRLMTGDEGVTESVTVFSRVRISLN
jgi:hypothetical protein